MSKNQFQETPLIPLAQTLRSNSPCDNDAALTGISSMTTRRAQEEPDGQYARLGGGGPWRRPPPSAGWAAVQGEAEEGTVENAVWQMVPRGRADQARGRRGKTIRPELPAPATSRRTARSVRWPAGVETRPLRAVRRN